MLNALRRGSINARRASDGLRNFFFQPIELHVEPADLLEQLSLARLLRRRLLSMIARLEQTGGAQHELLLPELHLGRMNVEQRAELLRGFLALKRRQRDLGLELSVANLFLAGHDSLL